MKASIKFREDQKPLLRAKVPISILSFPFQLGIAAGESKELSLSLGTFFDAGPSIKFSYRPNDSQKPFSFVPKTGLGNYGPRNSSSGSDGESGDYVLDTRQNEDADESSTAKHLESANTMFSFIWWIIGFWW
ncbi:PREDICTED: E3 ubiquitin-protein ligase At1g63170-like [Ipomoea nil]|uniref:E3 ubiquitin-protein ligase At1g63170-like n=1 Tax=Ipomoea nil TaxID=35883 RepID=UPI0009012208|nr:PREDICTED: E3 ubiquitin-protein ligase At1g63170-like [Ipomoea nil]